MSQPNSPSLLARSLKSLAGVEPHELTAVLLSMVYLFFLFGSYSVVKPVRDAMGTVYGIKHLNELFTGTFIGTLILAPLYAGMASRIKLSTFLPWVYGFIAVTILGFYLLFSGGKVSGRYVAAGFYIWVSTFNMLIISVFWSFMADIFSRSQAKRLFGFIAAGMTVGGIVGPLIATFLATRVGNSGLMLISAAGFAVTALLVKVLERARAKLVATSGSEAQRTNINHRLGGGNPLDEATVCWRNLPYLLLIAGFLFLVGFLDFNHRLHAAGGSDHQGVHGTTISARRPWCHRAGGQQPRGDHPAAGYRPHHQPSFGVKFSLLLNPIIMVFAFLAIAASHRCC